MSAAIRLRVGDAGDAVTIAALATQVFLDTYAAGGVRPDLAREVFHVCSREKFAARLAEQGRTFLLAFEGEGLRGFAEVLTAPSRAPDGDVTGSELVRLYVQPQAHGRGVGRLLLGEAEKLAHKAMWLTAWDANAKALAFYRRMGYEDIGTSVYTFEGRDYGNRILAKAVVTAG